MRLGLIFTLGDIYINSHLKPLTKFSTNSRTTEFKDFFLWNITQIISKTISISTKIDKLCDEKEHPLLSLKESQWKLRHQHDQNIFAYLASKERYKSKTTRLRQ